MRAGLVSGCRGSGETAGLVSLLALRAIPSLTSASRLPRPTPPGGLVGASRCLGWGFWHRRAIEAATMPATGGLTCRGAARGSPPHAPPPIARPTKPLAPEAPQAPVREARAPAWRRRRTPSSNTQSSVRVPTRDPRAGRWRCDAAGRGHRRGLDGPTMPKPPTKTSRRSHHASQPSGSGETAGRGQEGRRPQAFGMTRGQPSPPTRDRC